MKEGLRQAFSSIVFRQAIRSIVIMLAAVMLLGGVASFAIERELRSDLLRMIDVDIAGLTDILAQGGLTELQKRITDRVALEPVDAPHTYYRLANAAGIMLAGNMPSAPNLNFARSDTGVLSLAGANVLARGTRLRGNLTLVVGHSRAGIDHLRARLDRLVLAIGSGAVLLSLLASIASASQLRRRLLFINAAFARFSDGDLSARVGHQQDSDELAWLASHVDHHLEWAERLLSAQREISNNIAHELRTPLVHLDTRLLMVIDQNNDSNVNRELHDARGDIRHIVSLFDALLDLALAEAASDVHRTIAPFDLSACAADLVELYAASAEEVGLDFVARITPNVAMRGEPMAMIRLIANLLDNALKYVPPGGHIQLIVAPGPQIIVEDDGLGIAAGDHDRIFERFHRSVRSGSHGLGLALVRVIARRNGLVARVEDVRPGARFIIEPGASS